MKETNIFSKENYHTLLFKLLHSKHDGMNTIEAIILFFVALVVLFAFLMSFFVTPKLRINLRYLASIGLIAGVVAWSWKQVITSITNRGQLRILEILNSGPALSRAEIRDLLAKEHFFIGYFLSYILIRCLL